ncbi:MAG: hypothetical protein LBB16_03955 [Puniceicoccales bacterium]|jgi:hypothetical protein|nr:hypothetical protein [Puniceicoccales bacterium]
MKNLFFRRHCLFFTTIAILVICQILIIRNCFHAYRNRIIQNESVIALTNSLNAKRSKLPQDHLEKERQYKADIIKYRNFASKTWGNMSKLAYASNSHSLPPNHIAVFFEISDYLTWAKESCDALGVEFESTCSFGFKDFFEKNEQPLSNEIYDIHRQQEQLKLLLSYLLESRTSYLKIVSVERSDLPYSNYFENGDVFLPNVRQIEGNKSYLYKIKFTTFTDSFRNFLRNLYENEIPVIFRQISIHPNYTLKLTKNNPDQILECLASTFSLVVEFLDIPSKLVQSNKKNAALYRKILYETAP